MTHKAVFCLKLQRQQARFALLLWLMFSWLVQAEPADWYQWQSRLNGKLICKQTDPGEGWQRHDGPFVDAGCRLRKKN